jgi:hypothetical protein
MSGKDDHPQSMNTRGVETQREPRRCCNASPGSVMIKFFISRRSYSPSHPSPFARFPSGANSSELMLAYQNIGRFLILFRQLPCSPFVIIIIGIEPFRLGRD